MPPLRSMHKKTMMPDPVNAIITHYPFFERERRRRREHHVLRMIDSAGDPFNV